MYLFFQPRCFIPLLQQGPVHRVKTERRSIVAPSVPIRWMSMPRAVQSPPQHEGDDDAEGRPRHQDRTPLGTMKRHQSQTTNHVGTTTRLSRIDIASHPIY